jgi:hypothetical protein
MMMDDTSARLALADGNERVGGHSRLPPEGVQRWWTCTHMPSQACPSPACPEAAALTYMRWRPRSTGLGWPRHPAARRRTRSCGRRRGGRWRRCTTRASAAPSACPTTHPCTCRACWTTAACAPWSTRYHAPRRTADPLAREEVPHTCDGLEASVQSHLDRTAESSSSRGQQHGDAHSCCRASRTPFTLPDQFR